MPDPADQNARAHAEDAGQPQLRVAATFVAPTVN
jgi:hypothetical protein